MYIHISLRRMKKEVEVKKITIYQLIIHLCSDVVKYLLRWKNSPDAVNVANDAGRTCLHISAIVNNLQLCKLILDENAEKNPLMKNKVSLTFYVNFIFNFLTF